ncbi:hypothetical protein IWQ60_007275 [Tieghemiomyces parasiticus]|uniref:BZIP domain-containing protein n=1 Tax=Tieghemiomyces parasiticus TaxID=78921 RepID=A0A9W8DPK2_9FUNG|nr:hypothetical protein IWQ60_007275 [Tieghemiomyces parasiticus]
MEKPSPDPREVQRRQERRRSQNRTASRTHRERKREERNEQLQQVQALTEEAHALSQMVGLPREASDNLDELGASIGAYQLNGLESVDLDLSRISPEDLANMLATLQADSQTLQRMTEQEQTRS